MDTLQEACRDAGYTPLPAPEPQASSEVAAGQPGAPLEPTTVRCGADGRFMGAPGHSCKEG
jgi:hypothetical protein